jgi:hypothetical protein
MGIELCFAELKDPVKDKLMRGCRRVHRSVFFAGTIRSNSPCRLTANSLMCGFRATHFPAGGIHWG